MLTMGSLFDGIGGFPLAALHNGITPVWASEIESFPMEVTKIRFPEMIHVGDITKLNGARLPTVDIICGGSPCQDLSVAGQRRGLAGERSGLFMDQIRIVKEMREADGERGIPDHLIRPRYLVWENVPGAFSSAGGEDFRAVIEEIVRVKDRACHVPRPDAGRWESAGVAILGDEFSLAWRVLDAQFWGVAQRRRRIFLVADFGGRTAPQILFKQDRLPGNTAPGGEPRQGASASAEGGAADSGGTCLTPWDVQSRRIFPEGGTWPALYGGEGGGHGYIQTEETKEIQTFATEPVWCLNDQGGERMDVTEEMTATLRAGMSGHPPLVAQPDSVHDREMPQQPFFAAGVVSKGDGDCFLTPELHTSLTSGGGQAGQGYPCVLTAGFCENAGADVRWIDDQVKNTPALKTETAPPVLCLNDQGGSQMHLTEDFSGTLRAQEHGHQPLVFDNHAQDSRFTGPVKISQTVSAGFGMGGNNQPLVMATQQGGAEIGEGVCPTITASAGMSGNNQPVLLETICIAGNTIDRQPENGGNGLGCQPDVAYTLTATDHHAVFSRQRSDEFLENQVVATQSARQHKDATDLVCQTYQETVGTIGYSDHKGINNQYVSEDKCVVEKRNLIRRLTPLECERLQGFPDGWTDIPGASDSARYKALGNSVAIPCVDFVLRGVAYFLRRVKSGDNPAV